MRRKKGGVRNAQLSIFMVLAILVLLSGILWYALSDNFQKDEKQVSKESGPIESFISSCLSIASDSSFTTLGASGGYTMIPNEITSDPSSYLSNGPFEELRMPYWWHNGVSAVPSLEFMKSQLESSIEENTLSCLENFSSFSQTYFVDVESGPRVDVSFNEEESTITLHYPLNARTKDNSTSESLSDFTVSLPIRFLRIHSLAEAIMRSENRDAFIETKVLDMMALDPTNIPLTEMDVSCSPKTWRLETIRQRLIDLLSTNLGYIKIAGTDYSTTQYTPNPFGEETFENSYFNYHYVWDVGLDSPEAISAGVSFDPRYPLILNARPSQNGILSSSAQEGSGILKAFCLQISHFTYDLTFPVVVSIIEGKDPSKPYVFNFAFMASIDHNEPSRENYGYSVYETPETLSSESYCQSKDFEATIFTVDNSTGDDIRGVNLTFICGRYSCQVGSSDWISFGAASGLRSQFPFCNNGIISGKKSGYLESREFLQTDEDGRSTLLFLQPIHQISAITLLKHPFANLGFEEKLSPTDRATIFLKAKDANFERMAVIPLEGGSALEFLSDKEHTYTISVRIMREDSIIGGYEGEITLSPADLAGKKSLTINTITHSLNPDEEFEFISDLGKHSTLIQPPSFS